MSENIIEFKNVSKWFGEGENRTEVLSNINLTIKEGEFLAIVGFTGSGKTTLINLITGLDTPSEGVVLYKGEPITKPSLDRGVIFQNYSLLPWLNVYQNIELAVREMFPKWSKYYLNKVGLINDLDKRANEISQGMQQRVGIARAFAIKPKILLLDEPFGMLDSLTRTELQDILLEVWDKEKITAIQITHDVDESIYLADRIIMMTSGPKAKIGDVLNIEFERPRDRQEMINDKKYYEYRKHLIDFLEH
ncbi:UNVERIFIED_CONTAM: hypothetical protein GTU68_053658 [Idotea baltica]|nr:hypothetical protein [Idotea baltica]